MSDIAIRVDGLSKQYRIGGAQASYQTFREALVHAATSPIRWLRGEQWQQNTIWALDDVSFEVKHGEAVGIIGRNGAGKSTLLKILSRITKPTRGRVDLYGRVGSLLEVGTGFHPELTGRENIFLNGAILGMTRAEIVRKFDEIVNFAEIEKFLDTPVKHYSSGMYVRLAFAVAAHLEPEILLIDEVLAVGDAAFQKKSLGKMESVTKGGRTVLFVSHQLGMVKSLCETGLCLEDGTILAHGTADEVINQYGDFLDSRIDPTAVVVYEPEENKKVQIFEARLVNKAGDSSSKYQIFDDILLEVLYEIKEPIFGVALIFILKSREAPLFVSFDTDDQAELLAWREQGTYKATVKIPPILKSGRYDLDLSIGKLNAGAIDFRPNALTFEIEESNIDISVKSYSTRRPGLFASNLEWKTINLR